MKLVEFRGASREIDAIYIDRGPVWINPELVSGVYDHTILIDGHKIRVMEDVNELVKKLTEVEG